MRDTARPSINGQIDSPSASIHFAASRLSKGEAEATRDRLIHGYFTVKLEIAWHVVERDVAALVPSAKAR